MGLDIIDPRLNVASSLPRSQGSDLLHSVIRKSDDSSDPCIPLPPEVYHASCLDSHCCEPGLTRSIGVIREVSAGDDGKSFSYICCGGPPLEVCRNCGLNWFDSLIIVHRLIVEGSSCGHKESIVVVLLGIPPRDDPTNKIFKGDRTLPRGGGVGHVRFSARV